MSLIRHGVILAAGRGQRMTPLTDILPKPMAPYQGSTLIARGMSKLASKLDYIHVTVGYKGAMLAQHVIEHGASSVFNTEGHSNSWWIYHTLLKRLDEPVYVLTCDNVVDLNFQMIEDNYRDLGFPPCMVVPVRPVPGIEGDYVFHNNHQVTEITRNKESDTYCSGIQVLNPAVINRLTWEGAGFYSVWQQLVEQGKLMVSSVYPDSWFSVDTLEQLIDLSRLQV